MRRIVVLLVMVGVAYGVGWMSDAVLNDDPCVGASRHIVPIDQGEVRGSD